MPTRSEDFPEHYNPPYVGYDSAPPYNPPAAPAYDPPAGPPPGRGYGVGAGKRDSAETLKGEDPFADFDEPGRSGKHNESKDTLV